NLALEKVLWQISDDDFTYPEHVALFACMCETADGEPLRAGTARVLRERGLKADLDTLECMALPSVAALERLCSSLAARSAKRRAEYLDRLAREGLRAEA